MGPFIFLSYSVRTIYHIGLTYFVTPHTGPLFIQVNIVSSSVRFCLTLLYNKPSQDSIAFIKRHLLLCTRVHRLIEWLADLGWAQLGNFGLLGLALHCALGLNLLHVCSFTQGNGAVTALERVLSWWWQMCQLGSRNVMYLKTWAQNWYTVTLYWPKQITGPSLASMR